MFINIYVPDIIILLKSCTLSHIKFMRLSIFIHIGMSPPLAVRQIRIDKNKNLSVGWALASNRLCLKQNHGAKDQPDSLVSPSLPLFPFCLQVAIDREKWMVSQLRNWFGGRVTLTEHGKGRAILRDRDEGGIKNTEDDGENLMDIYYSIFTQKYIQNICISIYVCIYKLFK